MMFHHLPKTLKRRARPRCILSMSHENYSFPPDFRKRLRIKAKKIDKKEENCKYFQFFRQFDVRENCFHLSHDNIIMYAVLVPT